MITKEIWHTICQRPSPLAGTTCSSTSPSPLSPPSTEQQLVSSGPSKMERDQTVLNPFPFPRFLDETICCVWRTFLSACLKMVPSAFPQTIIKDISKKHTYAYSERTYGFSHTSSAATAEEAANLALDQVCTCPKSCRGGVKTHQHKYSLYVCVAKAFMRFWQSKKFSAPTLRAN